VTPRPRTCIGCKIKDSRLEMVRVVRRESAVVVDARATMQGRGAWVHRAPACLERALRSRAFERALKAAPLDTGAVEELFQSSGGTPPESRDKKAGRDPMGTR
jgi:Predicted nucleic-acid-binding protein implicated in transcription termination